MFFKPLTQGDKHKTFEIVVGPKPRGLPLFYPAFKNNG